MARKQRTIIWELWMEILRLQVKTAAISMVESMLDDDSEVKTIIYMVKMVTNEAEAKKKLSRQFLTSMMT